MKKLAGFSSLPKTVQLGLKKALHAERPFLAGPIFKGLGKLMGDKRVDNLYWKYINKPLVSADMTLGELAQKGVQKLTGGKLKGKIFSEAKILPTEMGKRVGAKAKEQAFATGRKEYTFPSVTAPIASVSKAVIPALGAMKVHEFIKGKENMKGKKVTKADLEKSAQMMITLKDQRNGLLKEARATELLYKQAELGQMEFPKTYTEYREKVAALLGKDLNVVEEAIKIASSTEELNGFGRLDHPKSGMKKNAHQTFFDELIEDQV